MLNEYPNTVADDMRNVIHQLTSAKTKRTLSVHVEICYLDGDQEQVIRYSRNVRASCLRGSVAADPSSTTVPATDVSI